MNKNVPVIIIGIIVYGLTFQVASLMFEKYLIYIQGPALPFLLVEQTLIPFVLGFYVYKYLNLEGNLSPLVVIIMPICLIVPFTLWDVIKGDDVTLYEHTLLFMLVASLQLLFVILGSYTQYMKKLKHITN